MRKKRAPKGRKCSLDADNRIENLELWSTSQPYGQRVEDKVKWAWEIINTYSTIRSI